MNRRSIRRRRASACGGERLFAPMWSQVAATPSMNRSMGVGGCEVSDPVAGRGFVVGVAGRCSRRRRTPGRGRRPPRSRTWASPRRSCRRPRVPRSGRCARIALAVYRRRAGRTRCGLLPICHGSRPSRCPGTTAGCRAARARRGDAQGPTSGCRRGGWRTPAGGMRSSTPRVPRLTAIMGSTSARRAQAMNSLRPKVLRSIDRQARSRRTGRCSTGPTPSGQS